MTAKSREPKPQPDDWLECEIPPVVPVLPLLSSVLFPLQVASVQIVRKQNLRLLEAVTEPDEIVAAGVFLDVEGPFGKSNLGSTATACRVLSRLKMADGTLRVVLQGLRRIRLEEITTTRPYFQGSACSVEESGTDSPALEVIVPQVLELLESLIQLDARYNEEILKIAERNVEDAARFSDLIADLIQFAYEDKRQLLETLDASSRLLLLIELLQREVARAEIAGEVEEKAEHSLDRAQREALLREQLRVIHEELDVLSPGEAEVEALLRKVDAAALPSLVAEEARREVQRLRSSSVRAREGASIRAYLDWVLSMPWEVRTKDRVDIRRARRMLDERFFSLENAKKQLLEFLAVRKMGKITRAKVLAIVGPPGTGCSSLAETIADILGRNFAKIAVMGVHDEEEFLGNNRTDPAASCGRILEAVHQAGSRNPVILIDDLNRLEVGAGDPLLAIIEAIDPARNQRFRDEYLGIAFDLSEVLFILTANVEEELPEALMDAIYLIELAGYTEQTKLSIAQKYVWPEVRDAHGLEPGSVGLAASALRKIMRRYTREAGVRQLTQRLETICRRVALRLTTGGSRRISVDGRTLKSYLGSPIYEDDILDREPQLGAATGLAWTETGGNLLPVEALVMPGDGSTTLTGLLGEVLQESVEAAQSFVRSRAEELHISAARFKKSDLHIHFPEGAIPKDGPSAGIAVATAIASVFSGRRVRHDIAMTGELSLRGRVLPVGGVREKVLAAYRAGIRDVILPRGNESDIQEIPPQIRSKVRIHRVGTMDEVFELALLRTRSGQKSKSTSGSSRRRKKKSARRRRPRAARRHKSQKRGNPVEGDT